jgi:hypothetical protein
MNDETCAYCYVASPEKLLCCGQCHKRKYCSKDCQRQDWKKCHHRHFCKVGVGEPNIDWEVKESPKGGLGVFALRPIEKDDIIMVERPILHWSTQEAVPEGDIPHPVFDLYPPDGTVADKCQINGMSTTDDDIEGGTTGLFIRMSRVNHDCLGNSIHTYLENRNLKILVASRTIEKGEEITFSYVSLRRGTSTRKLRLRLGYGFMCQCQVCTNPTLEAEMERMKELDDAILTLGSRGNPGLAIQKGKALLKLYDKHGISSWLYFRTYYDLYQVAITNRKTWTQGIRFIKKAYETSLAFTKDAHNPSVLQMKGYMDAPASHRNYMALDF